MKQEIRSDIFYESSVRLLTVGGRGLPEDPSAAIQPGTQVTDIIKSSTAFYASVQYFIEQQEKYCNKNAIQKSDNKIDVSLHRNGGEMYNAMIAGSVLFKPHQELKVHSAHLLGAQPL